MGTERPDSPSADTSPVRFEDRLAEFRGRLVDRAWRAFFVLALIGLFNNIYAISQHGWDASFVINASVALVLIGGTFFLHRVTLAFKVHVTLLLMVLVGLPNFLHAGMFGAGWYWFVTSCLLAAIFYSIPAGIAGMAAFGLLAAIVGYGYVSGTLRATLDLNARNGALDSWANFFITVILLSIVLLYAIGGYLKEIRGLIAEVQTQRDRAETARAEAARALAELSASQTRLIQSEKLAALGSLVAGVAHELNTPIGNALMISTTLTQQTEDLGTSLEAGLKRSLLDGYLADVASGNAILQRNLQRASNLIASFKQIAVDQTSSQRREFDLAEVCRESIITLSARLKQAPYTLLNEIPDGIKMDSYPGPLSQIMINVISNALTHAFEGRSEGLMRFGVSDLTDSSLTLTFSDNGIGIPDAVLPRVFDPFFTTKLGTGGNGLGLHIVHNIATGLLGGTIQIRTAPGQGTEFRFHLPRMAPQPAGGTA